MKLAWLGCLLFGSLLFAGNQDVDENVNTRYKVETVVVSGDGWTTSFTADQTVHDGQISSGLRKEIGELVGKNLNPSLLDDIARRLRREFHAQTVTHRVLRGASPEYVQVVFDIKLRPTKFDISVPKFLYQSSQGWTGAVEGTVTVKQNGFTFGLVSDGDELAERYAGIVARYENPHLGTDHVRLRFSFESYHEQWNRATLDQPGAETGVIAADIPGIYRTRQNFQPEVSFVLARPLTMTVGTSFERFQEQFPEARTMAANAVTGGVRYYQRLEGDENQQDLEADYNLRASTRALSADFVYARHRWEFRYTLTHGRHLLLDDLTGGIIVGQAPLFERFVLGNASTLRGWNKFDLDPLGGNRMVHNSVEYRYGVFEIFYDAGAIWDSGQTAVARHSIGVGLRQGSFSLAVAFPVRDGRADPIFMVGMNY